MSDLFCSIANLFKNRSLLAKLVLKNLRVRYRYLILGFFWAFLVPLFMVLIFKIVFSVILPVPQEKYPFFIYLMTAIFPWRYLQESISQGTTSILDNKNLIQELNFPCELIPISAVLANLLNFIPSLGVMLAFLYLFKLKISCLLLVLPFVVILQTILIVGIVLFTSSVYVRFRDIKYIVEIVLLGLFYLTPVFYPLNLVANHFSSLLLKLYLLNPFVGILNLYRYALLPDYLQILPNQVNLFNCLWVPLALSILIFLLGFHVFSKDKVNFADNLSR